MKAGFEGDEQARGPHCSDFLGDVNPEFWICLSGGVLTAESLFACE